MHQALQHLRRAVDVGAVDVEYWCRPAAQSRYAVAVPPRLGSMPAQECREACASSQTRTALQADLGLTHITPSHAPPCTSTPHFPPAALAPAAAAAAPCPPSTRACSNSTCCCQDAVIPGCYLLHNCCHNFNFAWPSTASLLSRLLPHKVARSSGPMLMRPHTVIGTCATLMAMPCGRAPRLGDSKTRLKSKNGTLSCGVIELPSLAILS